MRDHSAHIELSREEAVANMLGLLQPSFEKGRIDRIAVNDAYGRVLAEDVLYKTDVPNVLTCCMDSIALHWDDFANLLPGQLPDTSTWQRGVQWEFANTGVAMPEGFDTAIVIEHAKVSDDEQHVTIDAAPSERFVGTRAAGSQAKAGDVAVPAGRIITPDIAARISSAGWSSVAVVAKPRVAFIPTGNELIPANLPYAPSAPEKFAGTSKVYESNSTVVKGKVEAWGGTFVPFDIVPDEREAIREAVRKACEVADIVVLNAGSSKGSDDWSVEVLEDMGQIICHQTNHGPGHHSSYALVDGTPIVGISGPSGGASFTLNFYLLPLMCRFFGLDVTPHTIPAMLTADLSAGKMGKRAQVPADKLPGETRPAEATKPGDIFFSVKFLKLEADVEGRLTVTPVPGRPGSAESEVANAYYMMPAGPGMEPPKAGTLLQVELRNPTL